MYRFQEMEKGPRELDLCCRTWALSALDSIPRAYLARRPSPDCILMNWRLVLVFDYNETGSEQVQPRPSLSALILDLANVLCCSKGGTSGALYSVFFTVLASTISFSCGSQGQFEFYDLAEATKAALNSL